MPSAADRLTRPWLAVRRAVLRRRRPLAALLTAVGVAAGLSALTAPPAPTVTVLVAAADLPSGHVLDDGDLVEVDFAPGSVPDDVVGSGGAADAVGRMLAGPVRRGEPVTDVRLVGPDLTEGHDGLVAVPVRLPDAGMVGLLRVGDRIDLVAADPQQGGGAEPVALDVPVLALPGAEAEATGASDLPGRLVVVGADGDEVTAVADASVRSFVTFTWVSR